MGIRPMLAAALVAGAATRAAAAPHDACTTKPDESPRCYASEDEHMPQLDKGQVELTTLAHVPHDYNPSACKLVATWSGSEKGTTLAAAPASVTIEPDARTAHWRIQFPLVAADAAVRIEQTVTCPGGVHFGATARVVAADGAARRMCTGHGTQKSSLQVGDTEITITPQVNVVWRVQGTQWIDRCTNNVLFDTAKLTIGSLRTFVPDAVSLTEGEAQLAVAATGASMTLTPDELAAEIPSAVLSFDHPMTAADLRAVSTMLAPAAGALVLHSDHPSRRPR